jgi:hypothetical protein
MDMHEKARQFMDQHSLPSWDRLSLDEWLLEYRGQLPPEVYLDGLDLLRHFSGYGGEA